MTIDYYIDFYEIYKYLFLLHRLELQSMKEERLRKEEEKKEQERQRKEQERQRKEQERQRRERGSDGSGLMASGICTGVGCAMATSF